MSGLEGVVVADTVMSDVDGERGRLVIRGHDVEALAARATFEDAAGLLLLGRLPEGAERAAIQDRLGRARARAFAMLPRLGDALEADDGMDALRAATAHLRSVPGGGAGGAAAAGAEEAVGDAFRLAGAVAVFAAAWVRGRAGAAPVAPEAGLSHAADYLRMATETAPDAARTAALDRYLVTVSDHGMNASTFAARVVASTGSDLVSAIVAAIGALKGPLHGGAPGPVLDMLDAIGEPERAAAWLEGEVAAGRRIMGMGHRIYRVRDPRAAVLEAGVEAFERAGAGAGAGRRLPLARAVERAALGVLRARYPSRPLHANVEFYTAVLLDAIGLDRTLFTPTFAVGRVLGWAAHVDEQRRMGRILRPASRYVGPAPAGAPAEAGRA